MLSLITSHEIFLNPHRDMITDANILQGAIFHENFHAEGVQAEEGNAQAVPKLGSEPSNVKPKKPKQKPAAHRVSYEHPQAGNSDIDKTVFSI
jgi:hypothetical protein